MMIARKILFPIFILGGGTCTLPPALSLTPMPKSVGLSIGVQLEELLIMCTYGCTVVHNTAVKSFDPFR